MRFSFIFAFVDIRFGLVSIPIKKVLKASPELLESHFNDFIVSNLDRLMSSFDPVHLLELDTSSVFLKSICLIALGGVFPAYSVSSNLEMMRDGIALLLPPRGCSPFASFASKDFSGCRLCPPVNETCLLEALTIIAAKFESREQYLEFVRLTLVPFAAPVKGPLVEASNGILLEFVVALALVLCRLHYETVSAGQLFKDVSIVFSAELNLVPNHSFDRELAPFNSCEGTDVAIHTLKPRDKIVFIESTLSGNNMFLPT
ncbi:hypothetical protein GEMRC1_004469 [Eukaryota sp. GEM-RC1]